MLNDSKFIHDQNYKTIIAIKMIAGLLLSTIQC